MRKLFLPFWRNERGAAAVEFAILAPVLVAMFLAATQVWDASTRMNNLRLALRPATQYYMAGGTDDAQAKSFAMSSWQNAPSNATITSARACRCDQTTVDCATVTVCSSTNKVPAVFVTLTASGSWSGVAYGSSLSQSAVVRVK
jgi:Flp pilus assembly protein TadG